MSHVAPVFSGLLPVNFVRKITCVLYRLLPKFFKPLSKESTRQGLLDNSLIIMAKKEKKTRFAPKLHVKKGDKVKVIAGNDKGEVGEIIEMFPDKNRAIVEGVNMKKKHRKPTQDQPGWYC
jgi:transcription antitermination factor NusG